MTLNRSLTYITCTALAVVALTVAMSARRVSVSIVDTVSDSSTNGHAITTSAIDTTGADYLVLFGAIGTYQTAPTDSKGNTWIEVARDPGGGGGGTKLQVFVSIPTSVGSGHTFTWGDNNTYPGVAVYALTTGGVSAPYTRNVAGSTTSLGTGDQLLPQRAGLVLAGLALDVRTVGVAVGDGFSLDEEQIVRVGGWNYGVYAASKLAPEGTETPDWSWTTSSNAVAVTYLVNEADGGGGGGGATSFPFIGGLSSLLGLLSPSQQLGIYPTR